MSDTVWLLIDNGGVTEGVYSSPEQFTTLTGRELDERDIEFGKRSYSVRDADEYGDPLYHNILVEWDIDTHDFDYLYPGENRSYKPSGKVE
jgi:hypothetical protein